MTTAQGRRTSVGANCASFALSVTFHLSGQAFPQLCGRFCYCGQVVFRTHLLTRVAQGGSHRLDRFSKTCHPWVARHHPKMEVVCRVFIVDVIHVLDTQLALLLTSNALDQWQKFRCFGLAHFRQKAKMPLCGDDDLPGDWIGDVLVSMEKACFLDRASRDCSSSRRNLATQATRGGGKPAEKVIDR